MNLDLLPEAARLKIFNLLAAAPPASSAASAGNGQQSGHGPPDGAEPGGTPGLDGAGHCASGAMALPQLSLGLGIMDGFLQPDELQAARTGAEAALEERHHQAGMGGALQGADRVDAAARGDTMRWLHRDELRRSAVLPGLLLVVERLAALRQALAKRGYDVGGSQTYQLACYPGGGSRYVRHADASLTCPTRTITAICYLNEEWDPEVDGGALAVYNVPASGQPLPHGAEPSGGSSGGGGGGGVRRAGLAAGEPATLVSPLGGRLVVFESHLFHEVLPAHKHRYAVTAWFHRAPPQPQPSPQPEPQQQPPAASATASSTDESPAARRQQQQEQRPEGAHEGQQQQQERLDGLQPCAPLERQQQQQQGEDQPHQHTQRQQQDAQPQPHPAASTPTAPPPPPHSHPAAPPAVLQPPEMQSDDGCHHDSADRQRRAHQAAAELIFVSIASYRDQECQWTIKSLMTQAEQPGRVRVGVVWQVDPLADMHLVRVAGTDAGKRHAHPEWLQQVRQVVLPHVEATGPCKARWLAQQLWAGEQYVLQLDSHMRMVPGWDRLCIEQLHQAEAAAGCGKAVLSTYPSDYWGEGAEAVCPEGGGAAVMVLCGKGFGPEGFPRITGRTLLQRPAAPLRSHFWAAGLSFSRSQLLQEVPYCPHLPHLFFGEETYMLARMWTRGWDVFAPCVPIAFHQWSRSVRTHTYQRDVAAGHGQEGAPVSAGGAAAAAAATSPEAPAEGHRGDDDAAAVAAATAGAGHTAGSAKSTGLARERAETHALVRFVLGSQGPPGHAAQAGLAPPPARRGAGSAGQPQTAADGAAYLSSGATPTAAAGGQQRDAEGAGTSGMRRADAHAGLRGGSGDVDWLPGGRWGLGTQRSLAELEELCGMRFTAGVMEERAAWGGLDESAFA